LDERSKQTVALARKHLLKNCKRIQCLVYIQWREVSNIDHRNDVLSNVHYLFFVSSLLITLKQSPVNW